MATAISRLRNRALAPAATRTSRIFFGGIRARRDRIRTEDGECLLRQSLLDLLVTRERLPEDGRPDAGHRPACRGRRGQGGRLRLQDVGGRVAEQLCVGALNANTPISRAPPTQRLLSAGHRGWPGRRSSRCARRSIVTDGSCPKVTMQVAPRPKSNSRARSESMALPFVSIPTSLRMHLSPKDVGPSSSAANSRAEPVADAGSLVMIAPTRPAVSARQPAAERPR